MTVYEMLMPRQNFVKNQKTNMVVQNNKLMVTNCNYCLYISKYKMYNTLHTIQELSQIHIVLLQQQLSFLK